MLKSSQNPNKESLTITGLLIMSAPVITGIMQNFGMEVAETEFIEFMNAIAISVGSVTFVFGFLRRILNNLFKR